MSIYCGSISGGNNFGWLKWIFIFAALGSLFLLGYHAAHHSLANTVRNCDDKNLKIKLTNPSTGRNAYICQPDPEKDQYGRMITETDNGVEKEVTSFMSSEYRKNTLSAVIKNMCNQGYTEIQYISADIKDAVISILNTP